MSSTPPGPPQGSAPEPTWHDEYPGNAGPHTPATPWAAPGVGAGSTPYPPQPGQPGQPGQPVKARRRTPWLLAALVGLVVLALAAASIASFMSDDHTPANFSQSGGLPQGEQAPPAPVAQADASAPDWSATAAAVSPSVVSITVESGTSGGEGSGVVYDAKGHVLTNHHVVAAGGSDATILVTLADKRVFKARVVGSDPATASSRPAARSA